MTYIINILLSLLIVYPVKLVVYCIETAAQFFEDLCDLISDVFNL